MHWDEFVDAARSTSWLVYVGTADADGDPHVAVVSPGFSEGTIWFATRPSSKKFRNLAVNPKVAFHWPVDGDGPGEIFVRGAATVHMSIDARRTIWDSGVMPFDLSTFWSGPEDDDLAFVEVTVGLARLLGPGLKRQLWSPKPTGGG